MRIKARNIFLIGLLMLPVAGLHATPIFYPGVVSVDTVEVFPGDQFAVRVDLVGNNANTIEMLIRA